MKRTAMKKLLSLLLAALLAAAPLALTGCEQSDAGDGGRERVTIALWSDQLTEKYAAYLRDCFPDVDFTFYVATNSTDFYRFKEEQGDLPDILTVRRFALRDVAEWKDSLMDLSATELANTFHQSYLRSYTYNDGTVNWLPVCAEVDSVIVNKTLLDALDVPMPEDFEGFLGACAALREKGVRPFASDFSADYTCMELLQGLSADLLTTQEGREWRQQYESGKTNLLDEAVWLPVFERMARFIECAGLTEDDFCRNTEVFSAYMAGEAAMMRGTGEDAARYGGEGRESLLMPYFGETREGSWYLTYPAFQIAASKRAEQSGERRQLILDILSAMLSEEGQRRIAASQNMIPYNKDIRIDLSPAMAPLEPYTESNHLYIRLASSDMFSISREVVQGMIAGEYPDARAALDAFQAALGAPQAEQSAAVRVEKGYAYAFSADGGSEAASAVMNTVREEVGAQMLLAPAAAVAGNIAAGDYTEDELRYLTMGESPAIALCEMTGAQLYRLTEYLLTTPDKRGSVINDSTLYVSSGFEMAVRRTDGGYALEGLTVGGAALDKEAVYSVAVLGSMSLMLEDALAAAGASDYTQTETAYKQLIVDRLAAGRQLCEPTKYITVQ